MVSRFGADDNLYRLDLFLLYTNKMTQFDRQLFYPADSAG